MKILFQGDSITAGARGEAVGYPVHVQRILKEKFPSKSFEFSNTAVWGNRLSDFYARMERDIFDLEPELICLLIGVNNVLSYEVDNLATSEDFSKEYEKVLATIKENTGAKLLVLEPFMFENEPMRSHKIPYLLKYNQAIEPIGKKYADVYLPMQNYLSSLGENFTYKELTVDGLHLSDLGANIVAKRVVNALEKLI